MWLGQSLGAVAGQWWGDSQEAGAIAAGLSGQGGATGVLTGLADAITSLSGQGGMTAILTALIAEPPPTPEPETEQPTGGGGYRRFRRDFPRVRIIGGHLRERDEEEIIVILSALKELGYL